GGRSGSGAAFSYAARPSTEGDTPRLIQASLDPSGTVREAGAIAYNLLLAQEGREPPTPVERAPAATPATPPTPAAPVAPPVGDSASVAPAPTPTPTA